MRTPKATSAPDSVVFLPLLKRYVWFLAGLALLGGGGLFAYRALSPAQYRGTLKIKVGIVCDLLRNSPVNRRRIESLDAMKFAFDTTYPAPQGVSASLVITDPGAFDGPRFAQLSASSVDSAALKSYLDKSAGVLMERHGRVFDEQRAFLETRKASALTALQSASLSGPRFELKSMIEEFDQVLSPSGCFERTEILPQPVVIEAIPKRLVLFGIAGALAGMLLGLTLLFGLSFFREVLTLKPNSRS